MQDLFLLLLSFSPIASDKQVLEQKAERTLVEMDTHLRYESLSSSPAATDAAAAAAPSPYVWAVEVIPGFVLSWETILCATEIVAALSVSLYLMYRKAKRDRIDEPSSSSPTRAKALSPLTQPRSFCSIDALLYYRVAALVFYVVVQVYNMYHTRLRCMIFYTSWNFIGQGVYFGIAAWRTSQVRRSQQHRQGYTALLEENANSLDGKAHVSLVATRHRGWIRFELLLDVCLATSILVTVVVWTILYPYAIKMHVTEMLLNWVSYSQHAINLVILQVDFLCTRHTVSLDALPMLIAWSSIYSIFTWILHGTVAKGFWPYPFLQVDTPWAPLWYAGLLFAHLLGFAFVYLISSFKRSNEDPEEQH